FCQSSPMTDDPGVAALKRLIEQTRRAVVFTGAGVSTESGIPDFRSPGCIWSRYAPIEYAGFLRSSEMRRESWRRVLHTYESIASAEPNAARRAVAEWYRLGLVSGVVTQNIDGLHQKAGLPDSA